MKRRSFLKLVGVGTAVIATKPSILLDATPEKPEILLTDYLLSDRSLPKTVKRVGTQLGTERRGLPYTCDYRASAFILPAPAGRLCRAVIRIDPDGLGTFALFRHICAGHALGEVIIEQVRSVTAEGDRGIFHRPLDAGVIGVEGAPVEWPAITTSQRLELDYRGIGDGDVDFLFGAFWDRGDSQPTSCLPFGVH